MAEVSLSGSGPYVVTGSEYVATISAAGITSFKLSNSDDPDTNIVHAGYIRFPFGVVDGTAVDIRAAGTITVVENTATRIILSCSGNLQPVAGGSNYGTGDWTLVFYPHRIVGDAGMSFSTGTAISARPVDINLLSAYIADSYNYATTATGSHTLRNPGTSFANPVDAAGPFGLLFKTMHGSPEEDNYSLHFVVCAYAGYGTCELYDKDDNTQYATYLTQASLSQSTNYRQSFMIEPFGLLVDGNPAVNRAQARRISYLNHDPLSGAAGMGEVLAGTLKTDATLDDDDDGFREGAGSWAVTADTGRVKIRLSRDTAVSGENDHFLPVIDAYGVSGNLFYARTSTDGSTWTNLTSGTHYNVQASGTNRAFQYLAAAAGNLYLDVLWASAELEITTASPLPAGEISVAYSEVIAAQGGAAPYTFALDSGVLPDNVTIAANGTLSGTPTNSGTFNFTIEVVDDIGQSDTKAFVLTIAPAPTLSTGLGMCENGIPFAVQLAAGGGAGGFEYSLEDGVLPNGLTLSSGGLVSGTPDDTPGLYPVTIRATGALGGYVDAEYPYFTLYDAFTITSTSLANGMVGVAYAENVLVAGGAGGAAWSIIEGVLPPGIEIAYQGWQIAPLEGTPTAAGVYEFTIQGVDGLGAVASAELSITITGTLTVTTDGTLEPGAVGVAYEVTLAATGGTEPYTWEVSDGPLPGGLSLDEDTGVLSGTPTTPGSYDFGIRVTDDDGAIDEQQFEIDIDNPPVITTTSLPDATLGVAYSQQLTATGGTPPLAWTKTAGDIPDGMTFSVNGLLSGTPTVTDTFTFTIRVTDSLSNYTEREFELTVTAAVEVTTTALATAFWPSWAYSDTVETSGGVAPVTFAVTAGSLTAGLSLDEDTGVISGTPTARGISTFTVTATDANGATAEQVYTLTCMVKMFLPNGKPLIRYGLDDKPRIVLGAQKCCCHLTHYDEGRYGGMPLYAFAETEGTTLVAARTKTIGQRRIVLFVDDSSVVLDTLVNAGASGLSSTPYWYGNGGPYAQTRWFTRVVYLDGKYYTLDQGWGYPGVSPVVCWGLWSCYDAVTGELEWSELQGDAYQYPPGGAWHYTASPWNAAWGIAANAGAGEIWGFGPVTPGDAQMSLAIGRFSTADGSSLISSSGIPRAANISFDVPDTQAWGANTSGRPVVSLYDAGGGTMLAWVLAASVNKTTGAKGISLYRVDVSGVADGEATAEAEALLDCVAWTYEGAWAVSDGMGGYRMGAYPAWSQPLVWPIADGYYDFGYIVTWRGTGPDGTVNVYAVSFDADGEVRRGPEVIGTHSGYDRYTQILVAYPDEDCGYFGQYNTVSGDGGAIYRWDADTGEITEVLSGYGIPFMAPGHMAWVGAYRNGQPVAYKLVDLSVGAS